MDTAGGIIRLERIQKAKPFPPVFHRARLYAAGIPNKPEKSVALTATKMLFNKKLEPLSVQKLHG